MKRSLRLQRCPERGKPGRVERATPIHDAPSVVHHEGCWHALLPEGVRKLETLVDELLLRESVFPCELRDGLARFAHRDADDQRVVASVGLRVEAL